jgi:hypothetical protein
MFRLSKTANAGNEERFGKEPAHHSSGKLEEFRAGV